MAQIKGKGYAGQYLEIDLTNKTFKNVPVDEKMARDYIGGRAMAVKIMMDTMGANWGKIDPLGPDNMLIFSLGPLNPFVAGKMNVSFKSALNGIAYGSSVSTDMDADLKFAGWDAVVFKGKAPAWTTVVIEDQKVTFKDAANIVGKSREEILNQLYADYGHAIAPLYIGVGGEKLVKYAVVMSGPYRAAGRGGSGCIMGSKNLKAVVVKHTGPQPDVADQKGVDTMMEWCRINPPITGFSRHEYGTAGGIFTTGNVRSSEPVRNWQSEWHDNVEVRGEMFAADQWVRRYWADYGCTVACSKLGMVRDPNSKYRGYVGELPDYESGALLGTNLGIFTRPEMLVVTDLADVYGLDIISHGNVLGWACELQEKGLVTAAEMGGVTLKWGEADGFVKVTEMIAKRQGFGDTLAEGAVIAAKKVGKDSIKLVSAAKGLEMGAHGARSLKDKNEMTYCVCTHGGDHTSNAANSKVAETPIFADSLVQCSFLGLTQDQQIQFLNASTGFNVTKDELNNIMLPRWTTLQWITNRLAGWTHADDVNPARWYEPLPDGPFKGQAVSKEKENQLVQEYFKTLGWDKDGIPTKESMTKYGLDAFEPLIAPLRKA